jgi:hypothetical protein
MTPFGTLSLGETIDMLSVAIRRFDGDDPIVYFDFGNMFPRKYSLGSYRGYYDHLALGFVAFNTTKLSELIVDLKSTSGKTFEGWKGGMYRMDLDTPLWVANAGEATHTAIVGMCNCDYMPVIKTEFVP